ncbi:MAG: ABC transporter permease [Saprospiraceae bacterium]|nr:ABC transporter permease [Saprospiraceae bacterium]
MSLLEIFKLAFQTVRHNMLRSVLTLLIIAIGIMALVGILTSIDGIIYSMSSNFSYLGANSFSIDRKNENFRRHDRGKQAKTALPVTFAQATEFKDRFSSKALVSISFGASGNAVIKYQNSKTNPTIRVRGVDDIYFQVTGNEIAYGRNFSNHEQQYGINKIIVGNDIVKTLFDDQPLKALNQTITVNDQKYQIVGVLKSKGSSMNEGADQRVLIPLIKSKLEYATSESDFDITVGISVASQLDLIISQAIGEMRIVRSLKSFEENDFEVNKSDGIITFLKDNTVKLRTATIAIGLMTLLGAAIGLMNIMLVSVTERTKEIGISKALGATKKMILTQFLMEAIIICQCGGILGILVGIPLGNIVTIIMGGSFLIPWAWITLGLIVCTIVGILSGLYPALKAASLDPIEALRYE